MMMCCFGGGGGGGGRRGAGGAQLNDPTLCHPDAHAYGIRLFFLGTSRCLLGISEGQGFLGSWVLFFLCQVQKNAVRCTCLCASAKMLCKTLSIMNAWRSQVQRVHNSASIGLHEDHRVG